jgi:hypothetical protein
MIGGFRQAEFPESNYKSLLVMNKTKIIYFNLFVKVCNG